MEIVSAFLSLSRRGALAATQELWQGAVGSFAGAGWHCVSANSVVFSRLQRSSLPPPLVTGTAHRCQWHLSRDVAGPQPRDSDGRRRVCFRWPVSILRRSMALQMKLDRAMASGRLAACRCPIAVGTLLPGGYNENLGSRCNGIAGSARLSIVSVTDTLSYSGLKRGLGDETDRENETEGGLGRHSKQAGNLLRLKKSSPGGFARPETHHYRHGLSVRRSAAVVPPVNRCRPPRVRAAQLHVRPPPSLRLCR